MISRMSLYDSPVLGSIQNTKPGEWRDGNHGQLREGPGAPPRNTLRRGARYPTDGTPPFRRRLGAGRLRRGRPQAPPPGSTTSSLTPTSPSRPPTTAPSMSAPASSPATSATRAGFASPPPASASTRSARRASSPSSNSPAADAQPNVSARPPVAPPDQRSVHDKPEGGCNPEKVRIRLVDCFPASDVALRPIEHRPAFMLPEFRHVANTGIGESPVITHVRVGE
ncbi:hypothetical protein ACVLV4_002894 [Rathayibacter agropyri]